MTKRKFLVLGSNSFSGNDFIDLLLADPSQNEVVGISRGAEYLPFLLAYKSSRNLANFKFHRLDLNEDLPKIFDLIDTFRPDYVVNYAAQSEVAPSWENPAHWYQTNVISIGLLAHGLYRREFLKRYVQISSPEVYGNCTGIVKEDAPLNPSTPYASSKAGGDLALAPYFKNFGFPLVTIRSTNVYGPRQQLFKIIPRSVIYIQGEKTIELHGGGLAVKSFINIRDVSRGVLAATLNGRNGEIYHLSPDQGYSVREVVARVCNLMAVDFERVTKVVGERLGQDAAYVIDSSKARRDLCWAPEIGIDAGLKQVVGWVKEHWAKIKDQPLTYIHRR